MRIRILCLAASTLLAGSTLAARADSYTFTISTGSTSTTPGTTFVVSGTLTGTANLSNPSNPAIDLTSITGAGQGYAFTGVVPLGTNTSIAYDNLIFTDPSAAHVDALGDLITLTSPIGTSLAHVYNNGTYHVDIFDPNDPVDITPFAIDTFTLTPDAIPEPSSWLLLGTGVLAFALAAVTRKLVRGFNEPIPARHPMQEQPAPLRSRLHFFLTDIHSTGFFQSPAATAAAADSESPRSASAAREASASSTPESPESVRLFPSPRSRY